MCTRAKTVLVVNTFLGLSEVDVFLAIILSAFILRSFMRASPSVCGASAAILSSSESYADAFRRPLPPPAPALPPDPSPPSSSTSFDFLAAASSPPGRRGPAAGSGPSLPTPPMLRSGSQRRSALCWCGCWCGCWCWCAQVLVRSGSCDDKLKCQPVVYINDLRSRSFVAGTSDTIHAGCCLEGLSSLTAGPQAALPSVGALVLVRWMYPAGRKFKMSTGLCTIYDR